MNVELKTAIIGGGLIEMLSRNFHGMTEQNPGVRPRFKMPHEPAS